MLELTSKIFSVTSYHNHKCVKKLCSWDFWWDLLSQVRLLLILFDISQAAKRETICHDVELLFSYVLLSFLFIAYCCQHPCVRIQLNSQFHLERLLSEVTWKYLCDRHCNYYVNPLNTKMVQCFFYYFLKHWTFHYERSWANFVPQFIAKWAFMSKILINSPSRLSVTSWHFSSKSKKSDRLKEAGDNFLVYLL